MSYETIITQPQDVWSLFLKERDVLRTQLKEIAENPEFGVVVYLTCSAEMAEIVVDVDDNEFYSETCFNEQDCTATVRMVYEKYLTDKIIDIFCEDEEEQEQEKAYRRQQIEIDIDDRESQLDIAIYDFLGVVLDDFSLDDFTDESDKIYEDIKEHFLEYLARKWGLPIRRPMYLEDENGEEFFEEYPYDCMEFEDEDNPTYN